jgi:hypothetical protein
MIYDWGRGGGMCKWIGKMWKNDTDWQSRLENENYSTMKLGGFKNATEKAVFVSVAAKEFFNSFRKFSCKVFSLTIQLYFSTRATCPMVEEGTEVEKRQKQVTFDINQELRTQLDKLGQLLDL